jgi:hypothetical protein
MSDVKLYSPSEITAMLGLTDPQNRLVKKLIDSGELMAIEISRRVKRVSAQDWSRYLDSKKTAEKAFGRRGRKPRL